MLKILDMFLFELHDDSAFVFAAYNIQYMTKLILMQGSGFDYNAIYNWGEAQRGGQ